MASDLSTLVVEEGGVPADRLDDALQRQVLSGGGLDTVLLEMGLLDEATLLRLLARSENLPAIGKEVIDGADRAAVDMFPRRLAEKHGIVPLSLDGRVLSVAVARAPDMTLLDEIGFMLSVYVRPYVTTEARVAYALHRLYEVPLAPRVESVLALLGEDTGELTPLHVDGPADDGAPHPNPHESGAGWSVVSARLAVTEEDDEATSAPAGGATAEASLLGGAGPSAGANGAAHAASQASADEVRERLLARVEAEEAAERLREDQRRRERVRWTVDDAIAELALTDERDDMLDVALRFAYRRLSTVAIFVVQRTGAGEKRASFSLWDLIHPRLRRRDLASFTVPVTDGSALARLYEIRGPFLGPLSEDDPLVGAFGARPRAAVLVPIMVGDVLAGVLYGDNGEKVVPPSSLAELHMVVPRLGKALRNLILRRKKAAAAEETAEAASAVAVEPRAVIEASVPVIEVDLDDLEAASHEGEPVVDAGSDAEIDGLLEGQLVAASPGSFSQTGEPVLDEAEPHPAAAPVAAPVTAAAATGAPPPAARPSTTPPPLPPKRPAPTALREGEAAATSAAVVEAKPKPKASSATPPPLPRRAPKPAPEPAPAAPPRPAPQQAAPVVTGTLLDEPELATRPPASFAAAPVQTPGASARESLLLATWRDWLKHEDNDTDEQLGALQQPGEAGRTAASAVVAKGNDAMPSLARYFPGVLAVHPFGPMEQRPDVDDFSDAAACLVRLGADRAAPILVGELGHDDRLHRYTAVWLLSELHVPAALPRLAQRAFDPELRIALLALEVLDGYRDVAGFPKVVEWLREFLRRGDVFQRKRAILAAAELSDRDALDLLVNLLGTRPKEIADEARRALTDITLQDFGFSERRWRAWIADNARQARTRWLVEGLSHKDAEIRERAQQELNRLTGENFGYRADASRKDREAAIKVWDAWWSEQPADRWP